MSIKMYQFFCDHCGYKRFTKGDDIQDLVQVQQSPIPRGTPSLDNLAKPTRTSGLHQPADVNTKIIAPSPMKRAKVFKCPNCGYVIKAVKLTPVEIPDEQTNRTDGRETSTPGQTLPGELV